MTSAASGGEPMTLPYCPCCGGESSEAYWRREGAENTWRECIDCGCEWEESSRRPAVPKGWSVKPVDGGLIVSHNKFGGVVAVTDGTGIGIANEILYHFANAVIAAAPTADEAKSEGRT